jgi:hypothetical protein
VEAEEKIFQIITAAKRSLLQWGQTSTKVNYSYKLEQSFNPSCVNQQGGSHYIHTAQKNSGLCNNVYVLCTINK